MPKNAEKHISECFKFQFFLQQHAPGIPQRDCFSLLYFGNWQMY